MMMSFPRLFTTILIIFFVLFTTRKAYVKGQLNVITPNVINDEILRDFIETNDTQLTSILSENLHCLSDLRYFMQKLGQRQKWALKMFDAWAKAPPSGILYGNTINYGNFDECLSIKHQVENQEYYIQGKHCVITVEVPDPETKDVITEEDEIIYEDWRFLPQPTMNESKLALSLGFCFPNSCRSDTIYNLTSKLFKERLNMTLANYDQDEFCNSRSENIVKSFEFIDYSAITLYELYHLRRGRRGHLRYLIFSAYRNGRKIFTCNTYKSPEILHCINGIRVLSLIWIVFAHSYMTYVMNPLLNKAELKDWLKSMYSCIILGGSVAVDSFFLLSGVLVCWVILKDLNRGTRMNVFKLYFHRYLRLAPAFAALLLVCLSVFRFFGSGPLWNKILDSIVGPCNRNWWSALLFIQNYYNPEDICLGHSWYLSVDMQLFILAPFIVYPLFKWEKKIVPLLSALVLLSMGSAFYNSYQNEFKVSALDNILKGRTLEKGRLVYYPTHIRMGAYFVGVLLGYVLFSIKHRQIRLPKYIVACGWTLAITNCFTIVFGIYSFQQLDYEGSILIDAAYEALIRVLWAGSLAWIIFACVHGYGSVINWFLSWSMWQPLGKLSYSIYLLHYPIQIYFVSVQREPEFFSNIKAIHKFWGEFMLTVCLAIIWVLMFEMPILGIEEILYKNSRRRQEQVAQNQNTQITDEKSVTELIDEERGKN
uniref:CSON012115 protein n=1 Tax=Culicoides sonorensis TaxID=179676 RepID=A0A336KNE1_CULSO